MQQRYTPEFERQIDLTAQLGRPTRRGLLLGIAGAAFAVHRASAQKFKRRNRATEEAETSEDAFTGDLYGHTVAWDPDYWRFSIASEPGDVTDWVTLTALETFSGFHLEHGEVPFSTIEEAEDGALDHYLGIYGRTVDDIVHIESWSSRDAVGELYYWTGYDDNPYTYIEYAPTDDDGIWSIMYYQIRASSFDGPAMADELDAVSLDDEAPVRAADVDEIATAIEDDL